jgi:8-oxo-dGTP pyrophosphatase MutT (NUDIX family)
MSPVPAKPSATIVILRESSSGPEILLVKRRAGDAFGDSYTFPGGVVDNDESTSHAFSQGKTPDEADAVLSVAQGGLDYYSAAIRELFEETGILLARDAAGKWFHDGPNVDVLRKEVDQGALHWSDFLRDQELRMASDALHYFAHWETPLSLPKRWSTRFFLAELPPGQDATHDGSELTDCRWIIAADALSLGRDGGMKLPIPTVSTLKSLSEFGSVSEVIDWAECRMTQGIERILPDERTSGGKTKYVIPGNSDD